MTDFDKVVIPLLDENILPSDIDEQFVGCFTEDLDHPTDLPIVYMLFKCDKVTQNSISRTNRIEKCNNLHSSKLKMIDGTSCVAYGFILTGKKKSLITGNCDLDLKDCLKIASFWGYNDNIVNTINHMPCILIVNKEMPLEDFQYTVDDIFSGKTKEGEGLQICSPSPFIFFKNPCRSIGECQIESKSTWTKIAASEILSRLKVSSSERFVCFFLWHWCATRIT